jgi:hypothetical protein
VHLKGMLVELKKPGNVTREIIRKATEEDLDQDDHNREREQEAFEYCQQRIELRELKMDLSEVEVAFTATASPFFFSAEHRVDFRELVKDLAARFHAGSSCARSAFASRPSASTAAAVRARVLLLDLAQGLPSGHAQDGARAAALAQPRQDLGRLRRLMCCLSYELARYRDSAEQAAAGRHAAQDRQGRRHRDRAALPPGGGRPA